jgi:hypothetical protein
MRSAHDRWMWWVVFAIVSGTPKECTFGPGHWTGTAYQADIDDHWTIDAKVDLGGAVGTKVGTVAYPMKREDFAARQAT